MKEYFFAVMYTDGTDAEISNTNVSVRAAMLQIIHSEDDKEIDAISLIDVRHE